MIESSINCGKCGCAITNEASNITVDQRKPCPNCGSLTRAFSDVVHATIHVSASAEITFVPYPQTLLATCKGLIDDKQYGISVIVAHMACEVATERALSSAFASKGIQELKKPILDFANGFNLAKDRNRKLYTALTGDNIEEQSFWQAFTESATRRNKIIHEGKIINQEDAEKSYDAASQLISHLNQ